MTQSNTGRWNHGQLSPSIEDMPKSRYSGNVYQKIDAADSGART